VDILELIETNTLRQVNLKNCWSDLGCIAKVCAERRVNGEISVEERLFISSINGLAQNLAHEA
jgi:hypothetical protein